MLICSVFRLLIGWGGGGQQVPATGGGSIPPQGPQASARYSCHIFMIPIGRLCPHRNVCSLVRSTRPDAPGKKGGGTFPGVIFFILQDGYLAGVFSLYRVLVTGWSD